jgi:plastocyanin
MQAYTATSIVLAGGLAIVFAACGGGGSTPTAPSGGGSTTTVPTVTITANGADPRTIEITAGQQVRFVNNDGTTREILSTPHLMHTDCPPINAVGVLSPGANKTTGGLEVVRICGYHDHRNPDDQRFRGQINVGTSQGPPPSYVRP